MGKKNYKGDGVEQNFKESKKWFTLLAEGGNDWSYYGFAYLEYMSYKGIKEDKDIEKALDYLKKAFEPENNEFCIENDFLYSFDKSIIYLYLGEPIKFYEIPDSVKEIGPPLILWL